MGPIKYFTDLSVHLRAYGEYGPTFFYKRHRRWDKLNLSRTVQSSQCAPWNYHLVVAVLFDQTRPYNSANILVHKCITNVLYIFSCIHSYIYTYLCYTHELYIHKCVINGLKKCVTQISVINYVLLNN